MVDKAEFDQLHEALTSKIHQLNELTKHHQEELETFREQLQKWISIADESNLEAMAQSIENHFIEQQQKIPQLIHNQSETDPSMGMIDATVETTRTAQTDREIQMDPIKTQDGETQTESLQELLSMVKSDEMLIRFLFLFIL